jgi:hypothetical protein
MSDADRADGSAEEIDWENRRLCSDGNCIGVIGSDGRCKECGRPYEGSDGEFGMADASPPEEEALQVPPPETASPGAAAAGEDHGSASAEEIDWENRRLCSDGNCIGVIGSDGRCKECGRPG